MLKLSENLKGNQSSAKEVLAHYFKTWLNATLRDCKGRELEFLLAIVRTADIHTLRIANQYAMPRTDVVVSRNINVGAVVLVPELLAQANLTDRLEFWTTSNKLATWAAKKLEQAGALYVARRIATVERHGLSSCVFDARNSIVIGRGEVEDVEAQENSDRNLVNEWDKKQSTQKWRATMAEWDSLCSRPGPLFNHLRDGKLVVINAADRHFRTGLDLQILNSLEYSESDSFPDYVRLGPLTFGEWKGVAASIAALMAINMNHALKVGYKEKLPYRGLLNLLTRFLNDNSAVEFVLQYCPAAEPATALEILNVFTADQTDADRYRDRYDSPSPMLIKIPGGYIFTQKGPIDNPYWYMVEKLKLRYSNEWRVNAADVTVREATFQKELYGLFSEQTYAIGKANVKVKRVNGSVATDIDATLFERNTNTIYLFQLKWPDVYAGDWRPRESSASHLRKDGVKWVESVNEWRERLWTQSPQGLLTLLDLHRVVTDLNIQFRLIVLSRSWTRFSGKASYDDRAAWISWTRLRKLLIENQSPHSPLSVAWREMHTPAPPRRLVTLPWAIRLPDLTLRFES